MNGDDISVISIPGISSGKESEENRKAKSIGSKEKSMYPIGIFFIFSLFLAAVQFFPQ